MGLERGGLHDHANRLQRRALGLHATERGKFFVWERRKPKRPGWVKGPKKGKKKVIPGKHL